MACQGLLHIGAIPSPAKLATLAKKGYIHGVNVSGTDLTQIYQTAPLSWLKITQFHFYDVFSTSSLFLTSQTALNRIPHVLYEDCTSPYEREQFLQAVQTVISLITKYQAIYLFCYQGYGRAPTVAMAALQHVFNLPLEDVVKLVQTLRPHARLTQVSIAAVKYHMLMVNFNGEW
jgi:protein-tyrosine phosphatase